MAVLKQSDISDLFDDVESLVCLEESAQEDPFAFGDPRAIEYNKLGGKWVAYWPSFDELRDEIIDRFHKRAQLKAEGFEGVLFDEIRELEHRWYEILRSLRLAVEDFAVETPAPFKVTVVVPDWEPKDEKTFLAYLTELHRSYVGVVDAVREHYKKTIDGLNQRLSAVEEFVGNYKKS